jgi:OOP family OmpA-OmpF porin
MKKLLSSLALTATAATLAGSAHAQSMYSDPKSYIGGGLGQVDAGPNKGDYSDQRTAATTSTGKDNSTAWKAYGGVQLDKNWGVEFGYARLGKYSNDYSLSGTGSVGSSTNKLSAWTFAGTGTYPINDRFSLRGKAGIALLRSEYSFSGVGPSYLAGDSGTSRSTNLLLGVGGQYNLNKNMSLLVEYENFGKVGKSTNNLTTPGATGEARPSMISASVKYTF